MKADSSLVWNGRNPSFSFSLGRRGPRRTRRSLVNRLASGLVLAATLGLPSRVAEAQAPPTTFIAERDIAFPPQDVAITPSGQLAVVRSAGPTGAFVVPTTDEVTVWRVATGVRIPLASCDTNLGRGKIIAGYTSDGIAINDDVAVVIGSSASPQPFGPETKTQIDVIRLSGGPPRCGGQFTVNAFSSGQEGGLPSDVEITPDGRQAVVNHRNWVHILDLTTEPATIVGVQIGALSPCYPGPQSDSMAVTNTRAVVVTTRDVAPGFPHTWVYIFNISTLGVVSFVTVQEVGLDEEVVRPHDVAITPDGTKAVVSCNNRFVLFDLATGARTNSPVVANWDRLYGLPAVPVDSVELTNDRAVLLSHDTALGDWVVEVWDISPTLQFVKQFTGTQDHLPHDLAVREVSGKTYALISTGRTNVTLANWTTAGMHIPIVDVETNNPTANPTTYFATPFAETNPTEPTVFCSDSASIVGRGFNVDPPALYGMAIGAGQAPLVAPGIWLGAVRVVDFAVTPPSFPPVVPNGDLTFAYSTIPLDFASVHGGSDYLLRSWAPPSEANPALGGRDFTRAQIVGGPPTKIAELGGIGDSGNLKMLAVDSVASAGDYSVSIAEIDTTGQKGYVHFVKNGF